MKTDTFTPSFGLALLENIVVLVGIIVAAPVILLARRASHPAMTVAFAIEAGLVGGAVAFLYYTVRYLVRTPRNILVSESALVFRWRNGGETSVQWDDVRRAVFRARWGYRWKFFLDKSHPILWGDGFSAATWEQMSDLVVAQLTGRGVPMEHYDAYGKRVA